MSTGVHCMPEPNCFVQEALNPAVQWRQGVSNESSGGRSVKGVHESVMGKNNSGTGGHGNATSWYGSVMGAWLHEFMVYQNTFLCMANQIQNYSSTHS